MSRLDKLIKELCPNGVEYVILENIATIKARIGWQGLTKKEYLDSGDYYLVTGVDFKNNLVDWDNCHYVTRERYEQDANIQLKNEDVLVTKDGTLGKVAYINNMTKPATLNSGVFVVRSKTSSVVNKFLYYYLNSSYLMEFANSKLTGGTIKHLNQSVITQLPIPLVPLKVQHEIVRILDNFTKYIALLEKELVLRKKQYAYYRDMLLNFGDDVKWQALGEIIISLNTGLNPRKFFKLNTEDATNYYITIREIRNGKIIPNDKTDRINNKALQLCNKRSNLEIGDVLFSGTGTIGETAVITEKPTNWNIKEGVYTIKPIP
ncbi:MAG: restriction endonuclease subunit S, partial [Oscillospiraceae bacterium]|nr:restriction endonuclease subunit S [Oscillospiraceae bacterium]